jgi:hypothetical protein
MFRVGQKVVCVNARNQGGDPPFAVKGAIYIITDIDSDGELGLNFAELNMAPEHFLFAWRFRPIVERKTDISIFEKMLTPSDKKIGADA